MACDLSLVRYAETEGSVLQRGGGVQAGEAEGMVGTAAPRLTPPPCTLRCDQLFRPDAYYGDVSWFHRDVTGDTVPRSARRDGPYTAVNPAFGPKALIHREPLGKSTLN